MVPEGWKKVEIERKRGATVGKRDVYIYSPNGTYFRSRKKLQEYIETNKLTHHIDKFVLNLNKINTYFCSNEYLFGFSGEGDESRKSRNTLFWGELEWALTEPFRICFTVNTWQGKKWYVTESLGNRSTR